MSWGDRVAWETLNSRVVECIARVLRGIIGGRVIVLSNNSPFAPVNSLKRNRGINGRKEEGQNGQG